MHARMGEVDGVAGAGVVDAVARIVGQQPVVGWHCRARASQGRPELAALAGVVVDHVEDHLDARRRADALTAICISLEAAIGQIARLWREEAQRVVAPVVASALLDQMPVLQEGMDRQQLDRGDAQARSGRSRRAGQRREGAALAFGVSPAQHGEPSTCVS